MALDALPPADEKYTSVQSMFDRIAPRYDRVNRVITVGMDQGWRRACLDAIRVGPGDRVIDLACGTGDFCELARRRGAEVFGVDFAGGMLRGAVRRHIDARFIQGDAAGMPFEDGFGTVLTCGFALRNFVSLPDVFREMARVLAPGARFALLDVDRPDSALLRAGHSFYFDRVVPLVGRLLSDRSAYRYLPQSTAYLPPPDELRAMLSGVGFLDVGREVLLLGSAQILTGVRGPLTPVGGRPE